ncbi:MAG: helix-turn-helix transcriptional regulator [Bacteroidota bacterium]
MRESRGLTQEDAYNDTGIHFGRIERANSDIKLSTLVKVAEYFDIKLSDFFKEGFKL